MAKRFISIKVTICEGSNLQGGKLYYADDEIGLEISTELSYNEAMVQLRKIEKLLDKPAKLTINQFNKTIAYKSIYGYIGRE